MLIVSINNTWVRLWLKKPEEERQDKKAENEGLQDEREIYGTTFSFVKIKTTKKKQPNKNMQAKTTTAQKQPEQKCWKNMARNETKSTSGL